MNMYTGMGDGVEPIKFGKYPEDSLKLANGLEAKLVKYVQDRLTAQQAVRSRRLTRYARIDKMIAGWQKLTPEDSVRRKREEDSGNPQAIAANLPIADTHIADMTSFFSEIFAPASGPFLSNQGETDEVSAASKLAKRMAKDMKVDSYYATITSSIRTMLKYNMGGFFLNWQKGRTGIADPEDRSGNRIKNIDVYNFVYDPFIRDVNKIRTHGEWVGYIEVVNRFKFLRMVDRGFISNAEKIIGLRQESNTGSFAARYYKHSPGQAGLDDTGEDESTTFEAASANVNAMSESDWAGYGAGIEPGATIDIFGHELVHLYIWLNPKQLGIETQADSEDRLALYYIVLVDGDHIGHMEEMEKAVELPLYASYFKTDEMLNSTKSQAEEIRPFQRHINFYTNMTVAAERGNTFHQRVYDPQAITPPKTSGETSGWIPTKVPGRDVRSAVADLTEVADTARNWASIDNLFGLMQKLYPAQNLPAQIASLDRAVQSQVAAVMHGATQRLHMMVRYLDAIWQNPFRLACYRNYVDFGEGAEFGDLTEADVADLLNSGLGQLNREVAQAAIERLLFTLIQNPESAAQFDLPGLFQIWSLMLNTGVDLGQLIKNGGAGQQGAQPIPQGAAQPGTEGAPAQTASLTGGLA